MVILGPKSATRTTLHSKTTQGTRITTKSQLLKYCVPDYANYVAGDTLFKEWCRNLQFLDKSGLGVSGKVPTSFLSYVGTWMKEVDSKVGVVPFD